MAKNETFAIVMQIQIKAIPDKIDNPPQLMFVAQNPARPLLIVHTLIPVAAFRKLYVHPGSVLGILADLHNGLRQLLYDISAKLHFLFSKLRVQPAPVGNDILRRQTIQREYHNIHFAPLALADIVYIGQQFIQFVFHDIFHIIVYFHCGLLYAAGG
jgi:hypothetical protein